MAPGAQLPTQAPDTRAWFEQAVRLCHAPFESHVCGVIPAHCLALGERGDANPTLATLVSVAAAFEIALHELLAELG